MKKLALIIPLLFTAPGVAQAQDADTILASFAGGGPRLSGAVLEELMADPGRVNDFCRAADEAPYNVQVAVGAGFAEAYTYFMSQNDAVSAGQIAQVACTCELTAGQIVVSFAARLGGAQADVCSASWDGEVGPGPGLLRTGATADGGGGVTDN